MSHLMKILYLCADPGIPIRGHKGASIHVRALSNALCSLGHDVTILAAQPGPSDGPQTLTRLIGLPTTLAAPASSPADPEQAAIRAAQHLHQTAVQLLRQEGFDLIYERYSLWSDAGVRLAAGFDLPCIVEVNAPLRQEAARYRSLKDTELAARIEASVLRSATALVVVSEPLRAYLVQQGALPDKIHVIPNGVDETIFHPAVDGTAVRARFGLSDKFVIGFVGTARPWHDLETLIAALARLTSEPGQLPVGRTASPSPYHLLLVGEMPASVRQLAASRGLETLTTVIDPVPHAEIPEWLAAMDVAVSPHPALADFYFSPLKLLEYLACGRATVAADVPPIAALLTDGLHALRYSPGDSADLASRIASLAQDPARRASLGFQGARHVLLQHTWQQNARSVLALLGSTQASSQRYDPLEPDAGPGPIWDERMGIPLYAATRAEFAAKAVTKYLQSKDPSRAIQITGSKVLKYRPGRRCVLAYETVAAGNGRAGTSVIGKVFRDGRGESFFNAQNELWQHGFDSAAPDHIAVAEPIAYIPEMHMFLQARAPGSPLDHFLDSPDLEARVREAAAAIAKLHAARVRPPSTYSLDSELANLKTWAAALADLRPELAPAFRFHWDRLRLLASHLPSAVVAPIHRDFYYGQVLFSGSLVTLIDLDLLSFGDPAIDVANFAAHLRFLAIQFRPHPHDLDRMKEAFLQEYLLRRPIPAAGQNLRFYEAATYFRLMFVALTRPQFTRFFSSLFQACDETIRSQLEPIR